MLLVLNRNSFRVLFDKIVSVEKNTYFSIRDGQSITVPIV